jgi:hypothetical protein
LRDGLQVAGGGGGEGGGVVAGPSEVGFVNGGWQPICESGFRNDDADRTATWVVGDIGGGGGGGGWAPAHHSLALRSLLPDRSTTPVRCNDRARGALARASVRGF